MKISLIILCATIAFWTCNGSAVKQENATATINNINIVYDECGDSDTTLLFVHGWCINKSYWEEQRNFFCDRYKVVTLDPMIENPCRF